MGSKLLALPGLHASVDADLEKMAGDITDQLLSLRQRAPVVLGRTKAHLNAVQASVNAQEDALNRMSNSPPEDETPATFPKPAADPPAYTGPNLQTPGLEKPAT